MNLSICIIAKNEEQNIARCLKSLMPYEVEIIVADTGSTDRTKEIAFQYTQNVYDFVWCDDFAVAKNFAISKATNSYVMILDSDEFVEQLDVATLVRLISDNSNKVGRIKRRNYFSRNGKTQENEEWINRIFKKGVFHYEGRIHEQVTAFDRLAYETFKTSVVIGHTGYDLTEEERKAKAGRNILLLEKELERLLAEHGVESIAEDIEKQAGNPDKDFAAEQIPYVIYQLGKGYYLAGDYVLACEYFGLGLSYDLEPKLEYVIDMVETYGYAMINSGQAKQAMFFENIYEEFSDSADFVFLMGLIYMNNSCFEEAIREFGKATQYKECKSAGVNSYSAYYNIGVIYECLGEKEKACSYYKKCGQYEPAKCRIKQL